MIEQAIAPPIQQAASPHQQSLNHNSEATQQINALIRDPDFTPTLEQVFALAQRLSRYHQQALIARLEIFVKNPPVDHEQSERAWQHFQEIREILAHMPHYMSPEEALREVRGGGNDVHD